MKISVISVLYNQKLTAGNTWKTLLHPACQGEERFRTEESEKICFRKAGGDMTAGPEIRMILADNSTDPEIREENRKAAEACGAVFLDMQGNRGLPAACNRAIETIFCDTEPADISAEEQKYENEWIVVTDQDTVFPDEYIQILTYTAENTVCNILTPVVKSGEKQLSPCRRKGSRFVSYTNSALEEAELQEAFFINSGMAFRRELFADPAIRYDDNLFLDFTDFDLLNRLRSREQIRIGQLPGIILQQGFSGTEARTAEQDLERFRHFVHDGRLFYERWYGKGAAESAVRMRAVRLAVKHRDIRFLKKS